MLGLGMRELIVIFLIVLLLFGASRLPEIARSMGKSLKEFKKATKDAKNEVDTVAKLEDKKEDKE